MINARYQEDTDKIEMRMVVNGNWEFRLNRIEDTDLKELRIADLRELKTLT